MADQKVSLGFGVPIPFVDHLGFELVRFEDGQSQIDFNPRPEHMNSFNVTHGGAIMTLMDVTMAAAARSVQAEMGVVTIEMKTSFMQPATGALRGVGKLLHRTTKMAFTEAQLLDAQGRLCAQATGTFKYVQRPPKQAAAATHGATQTTQTLATD